MSGVKLDYTINFGNIIAAIVLIATFISFTNKVEARLTAIEVKVDKMWSNYWTVK